MVGHWLSQPLKKEVVDAMEVVKLCTEAKKRCIYAVSKQIGLSVDWNELDRLSDEDASKMIDRLKAKAAMTKTDVPSEFNQWRFGMVVKIVFDKCPYPYLKANPSVFEQEVKEVYDLVSSAERQLKSGQLESMPAIVEDMRLEKGD